MSLRLQAASTNDLKTIANLADEIWKEYYIHMISMQQIEYMLNKFYSEDSLKNQIEKGQQFFFIESENTVKGFVAISQINDSEFFIHKFYIRSESQGKSAGSDVMSLLDQKFHELSNGRNHEVRLTVNRQNFKAINFYFKNGFKIEKVEDFDIGNGYFMNDFVMLKKVH